MVSLQSCTGWKLGVTPTPTTPTTTYCVARLRRQDI